MTRFAIALFRLARTRGVEAAMRIWRRAADVDAMYGREGYGEAVVRLNVEVNAITGDAT